MVTELRYKNTNVNLNQEMQALMREDMAARKSDKKSDGMTAGISDRGEAAGRLASLSAERKAHERVLEESGAGNMHEILARQMGFDFVNLDDYPEPDFSILRMLSPDVVKSRKVYPVTFDQATNTLTLAISNPSDPTVIDDLRLALGCEIHAVLASESSIEDRIHQHYGLGDETLGSLLDEFSVQTTENVIRPVADNVIDLSDMVTLENSEPVVKTANLILLKAIQEHSSDVHIEPFENLLRIRYRVDGVLREMDSPPKAMQLGIVSRLKVMANLDIADTRRPQDGRINLLLPGQREVELRVTSVPTVHGESIVMRVLDKSVMQLGVHQIGLSQEVLEQFLRDARKPNGIVLVTGPTGCGKTTTLYACINAILTHDEKFITTEDPVEYQMDGLIQVNINESVGLTYARCLRAILRQDPDRILVGEIRDVETARISIQSALTGHLVFSTLHTNSAAGTVTRLIDMGVEPFLVTGTLQGVLGQRLVRTICPNCRELYTPTDEDLLEFGVLREDIQGINFYKGVGCGDCYYTGYRGRMGVFEYLVMTEEIADLVMNNATTDDIHDLAIRQGMASLRQDGWIKICSGLTTFSEVASATPVENLMTSAAKK
ncbi:MAG TPA: GspE/PulE family protein [Candidatus Sumerlaeota bacterium]|nr:GspE/PulE family protein [Candidatus Sumerlaeota bacterium]